MGWSTRARRSIFTKTSSCATDRLGYCFTPYQRLWLYNGTPLVAFYDTLGIRRSYSRLKPRRTHGGGGGGSNPTSPRAITLGWLSSSPTSEKTSNDARIITLKSNPSRGTALPAPHGKGNKCEFTRTRQIIRYRATATLRRPQNKQY